MHNRASIYLAAAATLSAANVSHGRDYDGIEVTVHVKNETSVFVNDGQKTGESISTLDRSGHDAGDLMKFENSAKFFFNGDFGESSSLHGELNLIYDTEGVNSDYKGHRSYTQHDYFRELYVDTSLSDWDLRLGKQQVVWGTADGIKLLDIVNPTDFRELNQNTFEDSRIPVWMVNAERNLGERGNVQFIVSQAEENKIPGLNSDGDSGHPFIFKGVDTITGRVNGFLHIAPALANVASSFHFASFGGLFDVNDDGAGDPQANGLAGFTGLTVDGFASIAQQLNDADNSIGTTGMFTGDESIRAGGSPGTLALPGGFLLNTIAQTPGAVGLPTANGNNNMTNLVTAAFFPNTADSAFEYMGNATFATFNTFASNGITPSTKTAYVRDYPEDINANLGARFRSYTDAGLNYSLNYFYHYDANPAVDISWHDASTGERLQTVLATSGDFNADTAPDFADPTGAAGGTTIPRAAVPTTTTLNGFGQATNATTVLLRNAAGEYYGAVAPNPTLARSANGTQVRFTESLNRIHSIGASFDYAFETDLAPIILRGEFLYDKDSLQPVVDKRLLAIGDLEGALKMEDADYFKYVLGADVTVMTNLLVSGQFIQFINLDHQDQNRQCVLQTNGVSGSVLDCSRYTAEFATLSLSNSLQKAKEYKEFYSLFFSKPFGEAQLGRWNNITIYEDGGGWWNRFDVEYSFTDQLIVSGELNLYFGDEETTFGQFENSSNIQLGVKYIIE